MSITSNEVSNDLWKNSGVDSENMHTAVKLSSKLLHEQNPYAAFKTVPAFPEEKVLISQSSLLRVHPSLAQKSYAGEIALAEFTHYLSQTYYFEVLGFQIIGSTAAGTSSFSHIHDLASQAADEARHIQIYLNILNSLESRSEAALCIPKMFQSIVENGSFEEKLVKGFLILEGMAIGLFAARSKMYSNSALADLDQIILKEEIEHQSRAKQFISLMIKEERMSYKSILEIMREGIRELSFELLPIQVAKHFGIDFDNETIASLWTSGLTGHQRTISRSNIKKVMSDLREVARSDSRINPHA